MNILYVTTVSSTLGFLKSHIISLLDAGYKVDIACNITKEIDPELINRGCQIKEIEFERTPININNMKTIKKLKEVILNGGYDIVHTHTPVASFITRLVCRNIDNTKVVYTAHGFHFFKGAPLKNWLLYYPIEKISARWTNSIITMNEEDYKIAQKRLSKRSRIYKINGVGIDLEKFQIEDGRNKYRETYGFKKNEFILFYAAELNKNKNQELLICSIASLKQRVPNIKLVLAGTGNLENRYKDMVNELNLNENVEFLGFTKEIPKLLSLSDVAVASSRREGLPVNILEAMAINIPIVATNVRGHRDLVKCNENGFLIENEKEFINSIMEIYNSNSLKDKFRSNNQELIKKYDKETVDLQIRNIYADIIS